MQPSVKSPLTEASLDLIFRNAHTLHGWKAQDISESTLHKLYDLVKLAPTSFNSQPARFVFVKSAEAKEKLKPCLMEANLEQTMTAPVTVIIAQDMKFYDQLPRTFPAFDARSFFINTPGAVEPTAFRNSSLSGGYMILAARALGLDIGAMSGFDNAAVDRAFFQGTDCKSNFLLNIGYGDPKKVYGRGLRLDFSEACQVL